MPACSPFVTVRTIIGTPHFALGALILGNWLRRNPTQTNAEKSSRIMHLLFFTVFSIPLAIPVFTPGLTHLDALTGLPSLPLKPLFLVLGILLALPGLYLMAASNKSLRALGSGANAFRLTRNIVAADVYRSTRNPMSLGYYLIALAVAFIGGSTLATLAVLLRVIPVHLFFLKFYEERELELRFGDSYREYHRKTPFLFPRIPALEAKKSAAR